MREIINGIFSFIGAPSLTDEEWAYLDMRVDGLSSGAEVYVALLAVLDAREAVTETRDRLRHYFLAKGVSLPEATPGNSSIFVGGVLSWF
jgi:hypothetical protein